jgi:CRP-like cAMP-binding protein
MHPKSHFFLGVPPNPRLFEFPPARDRRDENDPAFGPLMMPAWRDGAIKVEKQCAPPNVCLFRQGDPCSNVYIIESGIVRLSRSSVDGPSNVIGLRANGCILDAASAALDLPCAYTAETLTSTSVFVVPADVFREMLTNDRGFALDFNEHVVREIASLEDQEASLRLRSINERLLRLSTEFQYGNRKHVRNYTVAAESHDTPPFFQRL